MSVIEQPETSSERPALAGFRPKLAGFMMASSRIVKRDLPALLLLIAAAMAACWPVLLGARRTIIGPLGDNVQYVYMTGWVGQSLLLGQSPLVDPRLNFPASLPLATTDAPFLSMLLVAPATWLVGPVASYNLIILLSSIVSGYAAYLWVRQVSGSRFGGIVAGLAFLLSPFRIAHSYGHLQLVSTQGLPLFFWAIDTAARQRRPRLGTLLALAAATALVGCGSQYYQIMALLTGAAYVLVMLILDWRRVLQSKIQHLTSKIAVTVAVVSGALLSALPYLSVWRAGEFKPYTLAETRQWSANPSDFVLPSILHPLWGGLVARWAPQPAWIERTLYLGVVALLLAGGALMRRRNPYAAYVWPWAITALVGVVLALGTDLHWNNQPLQPDHPFLLPSALLVQLPFASLMRVWARFAIVPILFVSLLAGLGAARIQGADTRHETGEKAESRRQEDARSATDHRPPTTDHRFRLSSLVSRLLVLALLVLDLLPGSIQASTLQPRPIDRWLASQPGDFAVAFLPQINDQSNYLAMYGSLTHGKHMPAYNHPTHLPPEYTRFLETAVRFPTTAGALHWLGLRYVLLDRAAFDGVHSPAWSAVQTALAHTPSLHVQGEVDGYVVVAIQ